MADQKLRRILPEEEAQKLASANIQTASDLLNVGLFELMDRLDASGLEVEQLLNTVAQKCSPRPSSAWALYQIHLVQKDALSLEGPVEAVKHPSLCIGAGLTELVGAAGVGKTQACHMLAAMVAHRSSSVVYIDTEATFSPSRLVGMAQALFPNHYDTSAQSVFMVRSQVVEYLCSFVRLYHTADSRLTSLEDVVVEKDVQLVIIDSIAAPVRSEYDRKHIPQRQEFLSHCANALKLLSGNFNIPCLVTNQMTTRFSQKASESYLAAALGITWAHSVNTRFLLSDISQDPPLESSGSADDHSEDQSMDLNSPGKDVRRQITVSKSALFPSSTFPYEVWSGGLRVV